MTVAAAVAAAVRRRRRLLQRVCGCYGCPSGSSRRRCFERSCAPLMLSSAREPKLPEPASRRDPASQPSRSGAIAHPARWNRERSGAPPERVHSARKASAPGEHTENARSTPSVVVNDIPVSCCACAACQIAPTCEHSELVSAYNRARTGSNRAGNLSTQGTWSARRRRRACDAHKSSRDANSDPRAGADVVEPSGTSAGDAGARHRGLSSPREEVFRGEKTRLKPGQNRLRRVQRRFSGCCGV